MKILSIETSCDETAISIIDIKGGFTKPEIKIMADKVLSQAKLHAEYGGVFPTLAKREHARNLIPVLKEALKEAESLKPTKDLPLSNKGRSFVEKLFEREPQMLKDFLRFIEKTKIPDIDAIAVTYGPGLAPALWVGLNFAKALSFVWKKPLIPVNHMEGHIMAALLKNTQEKKDYEFEKIKFPAIALLISGGHTELVLMKDWLKYKVVGQTRDDAVGEAFDKVARMLGLPYPGGPEISRLAQLSQRDTAGNPTSKYKLPRPMIHSGDLDFSFSGLKTAVLYTIKKIPKLTPKIKADLAREFEEAAAEILTKKTVEAVQKYGAGTVILGGGVSANSRINQYLKKAIEKENPNIKLFTPRHTLSTDNALMIALAGYFRALRNEYAKNLDKLKADGNLKLK